MNKICYLVLWGGFLLICVRCTGPMNSKDYMDWVNDYENGLHVKKEEGGVVFDLLYKPVDYVLLERNIMPQDFAVAKQENDLQYFELVIGLKSQEDLIKSGVSDDVELQRKIYYYSYLFQNDIHLIEGDEKIPCVLYHFERSADIKGNRTFLLGFETRDILNNKATLVIDANHFGSLPVKIKISKENIPTLEI